ncbi:MAG: hypothetical protein K2J07_01525, partial [Muribaculaceae bacterium]|nr:hypothetical protein [Muribaculaceae bacterium]
MIYPKDKYESKIGFDHIKERLRGLCLSVGGREMVGDIEFSSDAKAIVHALNATREMVVTESSDEKLPLTSA